MPTLTPSQDDPTLSATISMASHADAESRQQFNALSQAMISALQNELDAITADPTLRVVVIAGAGKAFCAGHDLKEMRANHDKAFMQDLFRRCGKMMMTLTQMPQPVIARVHGIATAAGCQLVAMCDLAVAVDSARFATSGINVGLFCATPGVGLSRNLGRKQALEMLLTGDFIDAQAALQQGSGEPGRRRRCARCRG
jgi:enoyl-CoA hydratase/carnithine racemase